MDESTHITNRDWTHPYYFLKKVSRPLLSAAGYAEVSEELMPDVFGSMYSVFSCNNRRIRLIWDGKDGWGYAQNYVEKETNESKDWQDIECFLTEGDIDGVPQNESKINEFCEAIKNAIR